MIQTKRLLSLLLALLLLPLFVFAEEDEDIQWEDEDLSAPDTLLATDVFYHTPNEHSAVKCDHDVCFWQLEMGRMDEAAI